MDVRDVAQRLLSRLVHSQIDEFDFDEPVVLLAEEVTASLLAEVPRERLVAMISCAVRLTPRLHPGAGHGDTRQWA